MAISSLSPISCPFCKNTASTFEEVADYEFRLGPTTRYYSCDQCHTLFQSPALNFEQLGAYYPKNYFQEKNTASRFRLKLQKFFIQSGLNQIKKLTQTYIHKNSSDPVHFLDYGGGDGTFKNIAAECIPQWSFQIMEPHEKKYSVAGSSTDSKSSENSFDVIRMHHVIEHIPAQDLTQDLTHLFKMLKPGGVLLGQTPNSISLEKTFFKKYWGGYHSPRHTVVFSKTSLAVQLQKAGFKIIEVVGKPHPAQAAISLASLLKLPHPRFQAIFCIPFTVPLIFLDYFLGKGSVLNFTVQKPLKS